MAYVREDKTETSSESPRSAASSDRLVEELVNPPGGEAPVRTENADPYGRYDLSRDGGAAGCATDEGY